MAHHQVPLTDALVVVQAAVEDHVARLSLAAERGRELLFCLASLDQGRADRPEDTPARRKPRPAPSRVEPGSIPDRIREIVSESDEPMSLAQILKAKHGCKDYMVKTALRELVRAGHLTATGATLSRRFSLPTRRGRKR
jgi:hypothetical protein